MRTLCVPGDSNASLSLSFVLLIEVSRISTQFTKYTVYEVYWSVIVMCRVLVRFCSTSRSEVWSVYEACWLCSDSKAKLSPSFVLLTEIKIWNRTTRPRANVQNHLLWSFCTLYLLAGSVKAKIINTKIVFIIFGWGKVYAIHETCWPPLATHVFVVVFVWLVSNANQLLCLLTDEKYSQFIKLSMQTTQWLFRVPLFQLFCSVNWSS